MPAVGSIPSSQVNLMPGGPTLWGSAPPRSPYTYGSGRGSAPPWAGPPRTVDVNTSSSPATPPTDILGSEAVRATGSGPFDSAYRQNLATYSGGQFSRPGGSLSFNPTATAGAPDALGGIDTGGVAAGGGNAPLMGSPTDLLSLALGGSGGFGYTPPTPKTTSTTALPWQTTGWQQWLQQLKQQGGLLRGY